MESQSVEKVIIILENYNFMKARAEKIMKTPQRSYDIKSMNYAVIKPSTPTNQVHSSVESVVVHEVGERKELKELIKGINNVDYALERLDNVQREIITMRYIQALPWNVIEEQVAYGKRQCQRLANKGLRYMAGILDREQYNSELPLYKYLQEMENLGLKK
ncbi:MAG: hypothetical protein E6370_17590 [Clostridiales bacterium]|jgi:ArpU family phage transcriptional regulator|nr:hypothetical protein [Clostridiales bacterium]MDU6976082.1 hypothetical protein [Clostridiales bacterium]